METPVFDWVRSSWPDKAAAWDLGKRPVPARRSDASVLDPETAIVAVCEPEIYRQMSREWPDQDTAHGLDEAIHDLELERAAQPPVIEVTVTTPPDGMPRADLNRLVSDTVAKITGPQPALPPDGYFVSPQQRRRGGKVLLATRRARSGIYPADGLVTLPVSEDDVPTQEFPAVRPDEEWVHVEEVRLP